MSSILRDKSPALPSAAVLGAHAAMGRTRGKSLSPGVPEAHAGTDRLKRLLELIQSPRGQRRCKMPQFKREYQLYISVMVSTITSSLRGHRRPETEPAGVSSRSKTASLKSQKRANLPITISVFQFSPKDASLCGLAQGQSEYDIAWKRNSNKPLSANIRLQMTTLLTLCECAQTHRSRKGGKHQITLSGIIKSIQGSPVTTKGSH